MKEKIFSVLFIALVTLLAINANSPGDFKYAKSELKKSQFINSGNLSLNDMNFEKPKPVFHQTKNYSTITNGLSKTSYGDGIRSAFKVNYLSPIVRTLSVFYEYVITDNMSLHLGFFYTGFSAGDADFKTKFRGYGITPEFRFYPSSEAPEGFFLAPFLRYQNFTLSTPSYTDYDNNGNPITVTPKGILSTFGGGVLIGYQWVFGDIITFETFIGPKFSEVNLKLTDGKEDDFSIGTFSGFGVRFGTTVGIGF